jgi:hypothetical protein
MTELIHLEGHFHKIIQPELHKSIIQGTASIAKPLITEKNAEREKTWCDHKTWKLYYRQTMS